MEIDFITNDIVYTLDNLQEWMAPNHRPRGLANIGNKVCTVLMRVFREKGALLRAPRSQNLSFV